MGKAKVLSGGSEGLYTIQLDLGKSRVEARIAKLEKQEQDQTARLADLETALTDAEAALEAALETLNTAIQDYTDATNAADPQETEEDRAARIKAAEDKINALTESTVTAKRTEDMARLNRDICKAQIIETQKAIAAQQAIETEKTMQAWCVDYTDNATGEVATIEIPGEPRGIVLAASAPAPTPSDGILLSRAAMSPEQAYFNAAILPGWQKFKPTYRSGVIQSKDKETGKVNVTIEDAVSSAQGLDVNQQDVSLENVDVEYMTCGMEAFEIGDRCVVKFQGGDWKQPKVVGFVQNPKYCDIIIAFNIGGLYDRNDAPTRRSSEKSGTLMPTGALLDLTVFRIRRRIHVNTVDATYAPLRPFMNRFEKLEGCQTWSEVLSVGADRGPAYVSSAPNPMQISSDYFYNTVNMPGIYDKIDPPDTPTIVTTKTSAIFGRTDGGFFETWCDAEEDTATYGNVVSLTDDTLVYRQTVYRMKQDSIRALYKTRSDGNYDNYIRSYLGHNNVDRSNIAATPVATVALGSMPNVTLQLNGAGRIFEPKKFVACTLKVDQYTNMLLVRYKYKGNA
jgi:hypothetical protein